MLLRSPGASPRFSSETSCGLQGIRARSSACLPDKEALSRILRSGKLVSPPGLLSCCQILPHRLVPWFTWQGRAGLERGSSIDSKYPSGKIKPGKEDLVTPWCSEWKVCTLM